MTKDEYAEMVIGNRTVDGLLHLYLTEQITDNPTYVAVTALLRRAVIREASVGVGTVRRAGEAPLPDAPQMFVPWETKDGDYDLVPREAP